MAANERMQRAKLMSRSDDVFRTSIFDRVRWDDLRSIESRSNDGSIHGFETFKAEMFARLHGSPNKLDTVDTHLKHIEKIHDQMGETNEFRQLKSLTTGRGRFAANAVDSIAHRAAEILKQSNAPTEKESKQAKKEAAMDPEGDLSMLHREALDEKIQASIEHQDTNERDIRVALKIATEEATEDAAEANTVASVLGWGLGAGQDDDYANQDEALAMAKWLRMDPRAKKIIDAVGKMRNLMESSIASSVKKPSSIYVGHRLGRELAKTIIPDLAALAHPKLRTGFISRYARRTLRLRDTKPRAGKEMGDAVLFVDFSGSMQGQNEAHAKALSIGIAMRMKKQKRRCIVLAFDGYLRGSYDVCNSPSEMRSFLMLKASGGTSFDAAINVGIPHVKSIYDIRYENADVVFITDGVCNFTSDQARNHIRNNFGRLFAILVPPGRSTGLKLDGVEVLTSTIKEGADSIAVSLFQQI